MNLHPWFLDNLVCPRDQLRLSSEGDDLICPKGHSTLSWVEFRRLQDRTEQYPW